jgi:hypothetical protein
MTQGLRDTLFAQIPARQAALKDLKDKYGKVSLGEVTVEQVGLSLDSSQYDTPTYVCSVSAAGEAFE